MFKCMKCNSNLNYFTSNNTITTIIVKSNSLTPCICHKCKNIYEYGIGKIVSSSKNRTEVQLQLDILTTSIIDVKLPLSCEEFMNSHNEGDSLFILKNEKELYMYNYMNSTYYKNGEFNDVHSLMKVSTTTNLLWSVIIGMCIVAMINLYTYAHVPWYAKISFFIKIIPYLLLSWIFTEIIWKALNYLLVPNFYLSKKEINYHFNRIAYNSSILKNLKLEEISISLEKTEEYLTKFKEIEPTKGSTFENQFKIDAIKILSAQKELLIQAQSSKQDDLLKINADLIELSIQFNKLIL